MRKVFLATMAAILNTFMFSCSAEDITDSDTLYHTIATEGDDENPPPPPPPQGGDK